MVQKISQKNKFMDKGKNIMIMDQDFIVQIIQNQLKNGELALKEVAMQIDIRLIVQD